MATSNNGNRVFVVEPCSHDLTALDAHGRVSFIFERDDDRPGIFDREYESVVAARLAEEGFDPDHDYIAVAGAVVPLIRAISRAQATFGRVRVLFFNSMHRRYMPMELG